MRLGSSVCSPDHFFEVAKILPKIFLVSSLNKHENIQKCDTKSY